MLMPFGARKGQRAFTIFVLVTFLCQKNSITLQRMQASSILSWAVTIGLITSQLAPLKDTLPITTNDLLQVVNF
jgi:hypothetical protein